MGAVTSRAATSAPADAPATRSKLARNPGPCLTRQEATPRWYMPRNPHPHNDKFSAMEPLFGPLPERRVSAELVADCCCC